MGRDFLSIWFFIGVLLLIYGVIITALGVYGLFHPPDREIVLGHLHSGIWWGALLTVLGAVYSWHFRPGK
jgi:hypothetical protein